MDAIKVEHLCKTYSDFKLQDVTFALQEGCIMGLIGENGAGKSTTIKAILNLIRKESGTITVLGRDSVADQRTINEQIGVAFESSHFHDNLRVHEISKIMSKIYPCWDEKLFQSYQKQLNLPTQKYVKEYSRGMKMKLSIAAALAHHPKLLILDEATSGLDTVVRDEILDIFLAFIEDGEHSVLLSSHITSDLEKIADYITFLHQGKVVFSEEKDRLLDDMGVLRCSRELLEQMRGLPIVGCRNHSYGAEALISQKKLMKSKYPDLVIDDADLDQIMLFYVKGEQICRA